MATATADPAVADPAAAAADPKAADPKAADPKAADPKTEPAASADPAKTTPSAAAPASDTTPAPGGVIVPTAYTLTAPPDSYFDDAALAAIEADARVLKLPNAAAQELVTFRALQAKTLRDAGLAEVRADPEIGGTHYDETVELVKAGREWLAPKGSRAEQKLIALVDQTGLGNDVDLVRMFRRIGRAVREDGGGALGRSPAREQRSAAEILYDKTPTQ